MKAYNHNKFAQDPQRRAPAGWKVDNWLYRTVLTNAQRTGCQALITRVAQMKDAPRHELVLIADVVARAARGLVVAETVDIDTILENETPSET